MHLLAILRLCGLTVLTASFSLLAQVPNPGSEGKRQLEWIKEYPEALKRAAAEKKPLLIDITTDWCGWSKKMDRETFADLAVQKELRSFVLIRLNPEASDKNQKIADSFGGDGFPTLVVANYRGEEIGFSSGYLDGKGFLKFLRRHLPLFKGNPLGYNAIQLEAGDPLLQAIQKIPPPESRPMSVGAFIVLDQCAVQLQAGGAASLVARTATFIADPDKGDLPDATRYYVSSRQKLKFKSVRILDSKGAGREVDLTLADDEHTYSNQNVYWDARKLAVALPKLKEGQILDVIEEREFQPVLPNEFFYRWNTGTKILLTSDFTITFPPSLNLQKRAVRCPAAVSEKNNADGTITWALKTSNTKPYEPALFSPPFTEIWEGYDFYTPCTKDGTASWFAGLCQGRDLLPATARKRVAELKKSSVSQTALLQALADWVTKDIRYVSVLFGAASYQPHPVSDTLTNLYGDCKDQSLLLQALCREAAIPASLVLVDAFGEGFEEVCPAIDRFNHCIIEATADGKPYYVDPAWGRSQLGRVPQAYAGSRALKLDGRVGKTVILPSYVPAMDQESNQTTVRLNPNGSATVTQTSRLAGAAATRAKEQMKDTTPEKMRKYFEAANKNTGRKLLDFFMTDPTSATDIYETRIAYTVPQFASLTAGGLAFKLGSQGQEASWVGALSLPRTQPFRFRATDASRNSFAVELPPGTALKGRPEDVRIDTPFMKASRTAVFENNKLSVNETSWLLEARLNATEAPKVHATFRTLHDHRDYLYVIAMPAAPLSSAGNEAQPAVAGGPSPEPVKLLRLSGISGGATRRLAIINGKTLAPGEATSLTLNGRDLTVRCISIGPQSACVTVDGVSGTTQLQLASQ